MRWLQALAGDAVEGTTLAEPPTEVVVEYARHVGHADLLREAIDGATGE
jgi:hypothetical protein